MQKPLTVADSMQHIVVPGGFEVKLVVSEPQIKNPIWITWTSGDGSGSLSRSTIPIARAPPASRVVTAS